MAQYKRIAFARVILPDSQTLHREIVTFDQGGRPIAHCPLTAELPFVEWRDETYTWQ